MIQNCLLRYGDAASSGFVFDGNPQITGSAINQDPVFTEFNIAAMNLKPQLDSPAKNKGNLAVAAANPLDIYKINRTSSPTLGAYQ